MRYHNRNQTEEEKEEFAIAGEFEESKNLKELGRLLRDGKMGLGPSESPYLMLLTPESTDKRTPTEWIQPGVGC